jgi:hypothetical protein
MATAQAPITMIGAIANWQRGLPRHSKTMSKRLIDTISPPSTIRKNEIARREGSTMRCVSSLLF